MTLLQDDKLNLYVRNNLCNCMALFSNGRPFVENISEKKKLFLCAIEFHWYSDFINKLVLYL